MLAHLQGLLTAEEVRSLRAALESAPFEDGKNTARGAARLEKNNMQLPLEHPAAQAGAALLLEKVLSSDAFTQVAWPRHIQPFRFCRYEPGMSYGDHVDLPSMGEPGGAPLRTDLSMTVFLSSPEEYDGGQLVLSEELGVKMIRGQAGDAVIYPSNLIHRVEPVNRGTRLVAITWIQSRIRSAADRRLIYDMSRSIVALGKKLEADPTAAVELLRLRNCLYELTRRWLD